MVQYTGALFSGILRRRDGRFINPLLPLLQLLLHPPTSAHTHTTPASSNHLSKQNRKYQSKTHAKASSDWHHRRCYRYGSTPTPISIRPITHAHAQVVVEQSAARASLRAASDDVEAHLGGVGGLHLVVDPVQ